jgi:hypothetical protein
MCYIRWLPSTDSLRDWLLRSEIERQDQAGMKVLKRTQYRDQADMKVLKRTQYQETRLV